MTRSAIAPTWVLDRPDAMNMRSAIVVFPVRSIEMMFSALASSRLMMMASVKGSGVGAPVAGLAALRVAFE